MRFKSDGFFKKLYSTEENQISKRNSLFDNQCNYLYSWLIYSVPTRILLTLWRDKSSSIAPLEACNINVQAVLFYTFFVCFHKIILYHTTVAQNETQFCTIFFLKSEK